MQISVTFRHMEASEALKKHIHEKFEPLKKYLIKPIEVHVTLSVEKFRHTAEIVLNEQNFQAKALETTNDMYASIDLTIHKIEKQLKKHKDKIQEHHKHHGSMSDMTAEAEAEYMQRQRQEA